MAEIVGNCQLINLIGQGAMGSVYRAHHRKLNIDVAVKIINNQLIQQDGTFVSRFFREAQQAAKLNHPNIVRIYDVGYDSGLYYIIMEYINGYNLKEILKKVKKILPEVAVPLIIQALKGVSEAHLQGVLHRDLKPDNLMLNSRGILKITDFGLAKPMNQNEGIELTGSKVTMGTPTYMSIEQWQQGDIDAVELDERADIYSLGVSLFHLLTGTYIYRADSHAGIIRRMYAGERMDFLKTFVTVWEPDRMVKIKACKNEEDEKIIWDEIYKLYKNLDLLNFIIEKLTAFKRDNRYSSAELAVTDLENYINYLDKKQIELFNSTFIEKLVINDPLEDVESCDVIKKDEDTEIQAEKITFVKTAIPSKQPLKQAKLIKKSPRKINSINRDKLNNKHKLVQSDIIRNEDTPPRSLKRNNQNTVVLISIISAVIALLLIAIVVTSGDSNIDDKIENIKETSKPEEKTYTPTSKIINKTPDFTSKSDNNKKENKSDTAEEQKNLQQRTNQAKLTRLKLVFNSLSDKFNGLTKKQEESPDEVSEIREKVIDSWIQFLDCMLCLKQEIINFDHMIKSDDDVQPEVKYCELAEQLINILEKKEIQILNLLEGEVASFDFLKSLKEYNNLEISINNISEIYKNIMYIYEESEKLINEFIKIRNKIVSHKIIYKKATDILEEVEKKHRNSKRLIYKYETEIKKLKRVKEARISKIEMEQRNYEKLAKYYRITGAEERPFVKTQMEAALQNIEKAKKEYDETTKEIGKLNQLLDAIKKDEYKEKIKEYEEDVRELKKVDLSNFEKQKAEALLKIAKKEKVLKKGYSDLKKGFKEYHKSFCDFALKLKSVLNSELESIYTETSICQKKTELYLTDAENDLINVDKSEKKVEEFEKQVSEYENHVNKILGLYEISKGYMVDKSFDEIEDCLDELLFNKIEKDDFEKYDEFVKKFPNSKFTKQINNELYNRAMEGSLQHCFGFADVFPTDEKIDKIIDKCIELAKENRGIKACKDVIERFPKHSKIKELIEYVEDYKNKLYTKIFNRICNGDGEINQKIVIPAGEYEINKTLKVTETGQLEIRPGVTLQFAEGAGIDCYGTLIAKGTEESKIIFTAQDEKVGWRNISFYKKSDSINILYHCTITNGHGINKGSNNYGGGLYINNSIVNISYCEISKNDAAFGGGIGVYTDSNVNISNSIITANNSLMDGGGIVCADKAKLKITDTVFSNNTAKRIGGAICLQKAMGYFKKVDFKSNLAVNSGGGVQIGDATVTFEKCLFEKNEANKGGGIHFFDLNNSSLTNCIFRYNNATQYGGAIYLYSSSFKLTECEIFNNKSGISGGGIFINSGVISETNNNYKNNKPNDKN